MTLVFTVAPADPGDDPEEPRWRKDAPPSVVLFATDGRGGIAVLDHEGSDANYLLNYGDPESFKNTELRTWCFPGIWVWEGRVRSYRSSGPEHIEYDEEYDGQVRPMNDDEAEHFRLDDMVWDPKLWREVKT